MSYIDGRSKLFSHARTHAQKHTQQEAANFFTLEVIFTVIFTLELLFNLFGSWWRPFIAEAWNWFLRVCNCVCVCARPCVLVCACGNGSCACS